MKLIGAVFGYQFELSATAGAFSGRETCNRSCELLHGVDRRLANDSEGGAGCDIVYVKTIDGDL